MGSLAEERKGRMTVADAGRKGGETVKKKYGHEFYEEIGRKGGEKVARLIERGKGASKR
ncbi:MAG: KGG domain-containing protein [Chloroflexota bacterium]